MARLYQFMETAKILQPVLYSAGRERYVLAISFLHSGTGGRVSEKVITNE